MNRFGGEIVRAFRNIFLTVWITTPGIIVAEDSRGGIIWYAPIELSDSAHNAYSPKIALSGDATDDVRWSSDDSVRNLYVDRLHGTGLCIWRYKRWVISSR